jgi:anti-sigma factor ChrR (cupin superfamily)
MLINADFSRRALLASTAHQWIASPQAGVERVMLDRVGGERARATSIVRYAAGARFPRHEHPGGEEILVLSGTFSDEDGDYPAGWYLRNPPGSGHRPFSDEGAVIFVKLWQMTPDETRCVRIDTNDPASWRREGSRDVCALFSSESEQVNLQRLAAGAAVFPQPVPSAELLVLAGELRAGEGVYDRGSWMRFPAGEYPDIVAGEDGVTLYLKTLPASLAVRRLNEGGR